MYRVEPATITDAILTASSLAETDYAAWSAATTYAQGDRVIRTSTHRIYEALAAVGPSATPPESDATKWLDVSATNKWQPFDYYLADQATGDDISYTFTLATAADALLLFNTRCDSVDVLVEREVSAVRTNRILQSQTADHATWAKYQLSVTANQSAGPDGDVILDKLTESAAGTEHQLYQGVVKAEVATTYTFSAYARAGGRDWVYLLIQGFGSGQRTYAWFNLSTGQLGTSAAFGDHTYIDHGIEDVGDGLYRVWMVGTTDATSSVTPVIGLADADGVNVYVGDGSSGVYVGLIQLEEGDELTQYIPTTSTEVEATTQTITLMDESFAMREVPSAYDFTSWIFSIPEPIPDRAITIPGVPGATVTVTFNGTGVAVGQIVLGSAENWGETTWSTSFSHRDYSITAPDDFGVRKVTPRDSTFDFTFHVQIPPARVPLIKRRVQESAGRVAAYLGSLGAVYGSMTLGLMTKMDLDYANPGASNYTLQVEGLV